MPTVAGQHYLGALGPILAAIIVTAFSSGTAGIAELGRRILRWRVGLRWFLIAIFGPFVLFVISAIGVGLVTGHGLDIRHFGRSDEFPAFNIVGVFLIHTVTFGFGEEVGWRGFALPRLQRRHSALTATLLLTILWACWHLPAFFYRPGYSAMGAGEMAGWFLSLFTGAILLTWLYNSSRGSILIVALFHGSIDLAFTSKPIDAAVVNTMGALIVLWAIVVVAITGPTNLSLRARQQVQAEV
jgi:membrane protease YdiL (CAAX protease family)